MNLKELIELDLLQEIISGAENAEITLHNGCRVIEDRDNGKKYNLDKMKKRADALFDIFMKQYAI